MRGVFFVSLPGERHEDHIPLGIFTDGLTTAKKVIEYVVNLVGCEPNEVVCAPETADIAHIYYDGDLYCTVRRVPINEMCPAVLNT